MLRLGLELIGDINDNDEIKASSDDVQKLAYEDAAQQMTEFAEHEPRFLTMPNREVLDFQYNEESNQIEVGKMTSEGMNVLYTFDYDLSSSPEHNLSIAHDDLAGLDEFRMLSEEEIEQREKTALRWRITDNKLEMPSGDVLTVEYDKEKDTLNVAYTTLDGEDVSLTRTEFDILKLLMEHPGQVFSPNQIYEHVWQDNPYGTENTVAAIPTQIVDTSHLI